MRIEIGSRLQLAPRDTLVLASDGLTDNLLTSEVVGLVRSGPIDRAARGLVELASKRLSTSDERQPSKPDDLTFIIYRGFVDVKRRGR